MSSARFELVALLVLVLLLFGARYGRSSALLTSGERLLQSAFTPLVVGALSMAAVLWVWGSLAPPPLVSDEASYVLQAKIFASGRWSAPSPPLPEFFEQEHVLLVPRFTSKYPPGHALLLTPGERLGMPALVPLLLSGLTGLLVFLLARQVSNGWVAILTWLLWLSASGNLIYRASYFSEITTGALWVAGWWATLQWFKTSRPWLLVVLAAVVGWGAITRPLTMLAFAAPIGCVVIWKLWRLRRWGDVFAPLATVVAILAIIPLWSSRVTGDWRRTPLGVYTEAYMPWDVPGFGLRDVPATRKASPDARQKWDGFMVRHRNHQVARLPAIMRERIGALGENLFGGWRLWLLPAAIAGGFALNAAGLVALLCGASLILAYLVYAHPPSWVVYYMEVFPIPAFLVALGLWKVAMLLSERVRPHAKAAALPSTRASLGMLFVLPLLASFALIDAVVARSWWERRAAHKRQFDRLIAGIPDSQAVVFVRHSLSHSFLTSHVENDSDLGRARTWLVHDLGEQNAILRQVVPDRSAYFYDEDNATLERIRE